MYSFDENALIDELEKLPSRGRVAFAAAAATRQLSSYERLASEVNREDFQRPREIVSQLWTDLFDEVAVDRVAWLAKLDEVMGLLPEECEAWSVSHVLADDALSALAYAIRCLLSLKSQEAAWAARRAYEAADQAAIRYLSVQPGSTNTEATIRSHSFVQRELGRQRNDLTLLRADLIDETARLAFVDELLNEQEAAPL